MTIDANEAPLPSRRDALKAVGGLAVGAAAFWGAAEVASANIAGASQRQTVTHIPTTIAVKINGVSVSGITAVAPVVRAVGVVQSSDAKGFRNSPGPRAASSVSFSRLWSGDQGFQSWFEKSLGGATDRRSMTVTILGKRGSTISQLELSGVWPTGWSGPSWDAKSMGSAHATESLTCGYETFTYKK